MDKAAPTSGLPPASNDDAVIQLRRARVRERIGNSAQPLLPRPGLVSPLPSLPDAVESIRELGDPISQVPWTRRVAGLPEIASGIAAGVLYLEAANPWHLFSLGVIAGSAMGVRQLRMLHTRAEFRRQAESVLEIYRELDREFRSGHLELTYPKNIHTRNDKPKAPVLRWYPPADIPRDRLRLELAHLANACMPLEIEISVPEAALEMINRRDMNYAPHLPLHDLSVSHHTHVASRNPDDHAYVAVMTPERLIEFLSQPPAVVEKIDAVSYLAGVLERQNPRHPLVQFYQTWENAQENPERPTVMAQRDRQIARKARSELERRLNNSANRTEDRFSDTRITTDLSAEPSEGTAAPPTSLRARIVHTRRGTLIDWKKRNGELVSRTTPHEVFSLTDRSAAEIVAHPNGSTPQQVVLACEFLMCRIGSPNGARVRALLNAVAATEVIEKPNVRMPNNHPLQERVVAQALTGKMFKKTQSSSDALTVETRGRRAWSIAAAVTAGLVLGGASHNYYQWRIHSIRSAISHQLENRGIPDDLANKVADRMAREKGDPFTRGVGRVEKGARGLDHELGGPNVKQPNLDPQSGAGDSDWESSNSGQLESSNVPSVPNNVTNPEINHREPDWYTTPNNNMSAAGFWPEMAENELAVNGGDQPMFWEPALRDSQVSNSELPTSVANSEKSIRVERVITLDELSGYLDDYLVTDVPVLSGSELSAAQLVTHSGKEIPLHRVINSDGTRSLAVLGSDVSDSEFLLRYWITPDARGVHAHAESGTQLDTASTTTDQEAKKVQDVLKAHGAASQPHSVATDEAALRGLKYSSNPVAPGDADQVVTPSSLAKYAFRRGVASAREANTLLVTANPDDMDYLEGYKNGDPNSRFLSPGEEHGVGVDTHGRMFDATPQSNQSIHPPEHYQGSRPKFAIHRGPSPVDRRAYIGAIVAVNLAAAFFQRRRVAKIRLDKAWQKIDALSDQQLQQVAIAFSYAMYSPAGASFATSGPYKYPTAIFRTARDIEQGDKTEILRGRLRELKTKGATPEARVAGRDALNVLNWTRYYLKQEEKLRGTRLAVDQSMPRFASRNYSQRRTPPVNLKTKPIAELDMTEAQLHAAADAINHVLFGPDSAGEVAWQSDVQRLFGINTHDEPSARRVIGLVNSVVRSGNRKSVLDHLKAAKKTMASVEDRQACSDAFEILRTNRILRPSPTATVVSATASR